MALHSSGGGDLDAGNHEVFIKIFGERNTGTNYLEKLINENMQVAMLPGTGPVAVARLGRRLRAHWPTDLYFALTRHHYLGWKHSPAHLPEPLPTKFQGRLCLVMLMKNPYSWLLSLWRRPYHNMRSVRRIPDFHEFITTPWPALSRDWYTAREYVSPVDLWNHKVGSFFGFHGVPSVRLRYEDLLAAPEGALAQIAEAARVPLTGDFSNILDSTKRRDSRDNEAYRNYYLNEEWREKLDGEVIAEINRRLDLDILRKAGYELLPEPGQFLAPARAS